MGVLDGYLALSRNGGLGLSRLRFEKTIWKKFSNNNNNLI